MQLSENFTVSAKPTTPESRKATADAIEQAIGALITGKLKPGKLPIELLTQAVQGLRDAAAQADPVAREDFDKLSADLTRAKNLLVRLYEQVKYDPNRIQPMIEEATGAWFVWGQDRDVAVIEPQPQQVARTSIDDRIANAQAEIAGWSPAKLASMQLQGPAAGDAS